MVTETGQAQVKTLENQKRVFQLINEHFHLYVKQPNYTFYESLMEYHASETIMPFSTALENPAVHSELLQPIYDFLDNFRSLVKCEDMMILGRLQADYRLKMRKNKNMIL